ncbi:Alpha-hemolysin translocation ATP-binding protein HlyB [Rubripirellula obstinata]|uniref:Alpha-hemolysin translocation ATP-binding protein HlyB n=1 Tax=Rubripirellula obstinata TaxID=406547 RepID=A0A5B1CEN8_9BACT|nr:ABC transporter ATP-binding protein [Rubripirellula obstinata]KAA1259618.1 Alpha-hemolysin translocation ATP-binding protein HlyB [Rubripirellula obstinata]
MATPNDDQNDDQDAYFRQEVLYKVLTRLGFAFGISIEPSDMQAGIDPDDSGTYDPMSPLVASAKHTGFYLRETEVESAAQVFGFVREGYPVVIASSGNEFLVLEKAAGRRLEGSLIRDRTETLSVTKRMIRRRLSASPPPRVFVAKRELSMASISASNDYQPGDDRSGDHHGDHGHGHHHDHPSPVRRFIGLLALDRRDLGTIVLFAAVAGVLGLATPLAIESLVNVVSWGTYIQPLIVLGLMLLTCLGLSGVLKVLQAVLVEIIQRRQFVRIVSDLAHRFPRANQASLIGEYPRELANRVFDIMTIQKATAVLFVDGVSIVLTTLIGLILLAFYHPFLLGFDIVLVILMISVTWVLGRGGISTAIDESITKYRVAHWLQDVLSTPAIFKANDGEGLAVQRANQLTSDYIYARQDQFRVIIRQIIFAISLQVLASTALLALGGWLVIIGELTLGQLVASELVVTVVVGAFAKAGKSLEKFYDLMAGVDKVGHLIDIETDDRYELFLTTAGPVQVSWGDLTFKGATSSSKIPSAQIVAGSRAALVGDDVHGRSMLTRTLAGLVKPSSGIAKIDEFDSLHASSNGPERLIAYAGRDKMFHGTLRDNIDLGRPGISQNKVRDALGLVGLTEMVAALPDGLNTQIQTGGYPLTQPQCHQIAIARAILLSPGLLIVDGLLDELSSSDRQTVWQALSHSNAPWTLLLNTNRDDIAELCDIQIAVR